MIEEMMLSILLFLGVVCPMILLSLLFSGKIGTPQEKRGSEYYEQRAEEYWRTRK